MMQGYDDCTLCPRMCRVNREEGERGYCKQPSSVLIARSSLHKWEEPPISGSSGSGTVFFSGCSLGCIYCQNHAISRDSVGDAFDAPRIAEIMFDLKRSEAMNINLVTPTHFAPTLREAISNAKSSGLGLPIVWNTSGYERVESIGENRSLIDIYLTDMKYADRGIAKRFSNAEDYPDVAIRAIARMVDTTKRVRFDHHMGQERLLSGVVVRHMVIPGHVEDSKRVLAALHSEFGNDILYSIMNQYTPVLASLSSLGSVLASKHLERYPELGRSVADEEYEEVLDFADSIGIDDYFWQDGETCKESFIPEFPQR